jgi:hypothetical protein
LTAIGCYTKLYINSNVAVKLMKRTDFEGTTSISVVDVIFGALDVIG